MSLISLDYCSPIWSPRHKDINNLEKIQTGGEIRDELTMAGQGAWQCDQYATGDGMGQPGNHKEKESLVSFYKLVNNGCFAILI